MGSVRGVNNLVRDKWVGRAQAYAETFAGQCAHTVEPMLDALGAGPGTRLLDVGTGAGAIAAAALRRGADVTASDPEPDMLALAADAAPTATLVRAALPRLPFPDRTFDLVSANFVVNHVPDPRAAVAELARVLALGGRVGLSVWPSTSMPLRAIFADTIVESGVRVPSSVAPLPPALDFPRTPDGLAGLLGDAGLRIERAWVQEFVHLVDQELWWSGVERGVADTGQVFLAQAAPGRAAMAAAYRRLSAAHLGADGLLHLAGAAVVAIGVR